MEKPKTPVIKKGNPDHMEADLKSTRDRRNESLANNERIASEKPHHIDSLSETFLDYDTIQMLLA